MKNLIRNLIVTSALMVAAVGISGCAIAARSVDSGADLSTVASSDRSVVFGKFRLVRNGNEAQFEDNILSVPPTLTLKRVGSDLELVGDVGEDGEFAWVLEPGFYRVSSIGFSNLGERVEPVTNFTFVVDGAHEAVYVGTVTLEATFDSGYYGVNGTIDRYSVSNDCATDCASRLGDIGMEVEDSTISLMLQQSPLASAN
ncbi:MAG: hypothetical protein JJ992_26440 [Planctomycetes bacterium]|nr:hypothetical protein [Planctomycetota bacterium]